MDEALPHLRGYQNNTVWVGQVKVPLTGGLAILSGSEAVAGKRGGGGYVF
jgi:hypothetical protein